MKVLAASRNTVAEASRRKPALDQRFERKFRTDR